MMSERLLRRLEDSEFLRAKELLVSGLITNLMSSLPGSQRTRNAVELKLSNIDSVVARLQNHLERPLHRLVDRRDGSHYQWSLSSTVRASLHDRGILADPDIEPEPAPRRKPGASDWSAEENRQIVAGYLEVQELLARLRDDEG